jgi:hypothetical protein
MGSTKISAPAAPTVDSSMADYVKNYPKLFELQQQYSPQEAQMQVDLATKYAQPLGQAYKTAQEAMYPGETAITNSLNQQVQQGMQSGVPDWQRDAYLSNLRANLGTNAGSGVGADYTSLGLLQQQQDWKQYYNNLGLSITGRQPISTATTPQTNNILGNYTPSSVLGFNSNVYGTQSSIFGAQQQAASQGNPFFNSIMGVAGMGLGGWMGK